MCRAPTCGRASAVSLPGGRPAVRPPGLAGAACRASAGVGGAGAEPWVGDEYNDVTSFVFHGKGGEEDAFEVKIGLLGLPAAGKSTLLRLLTKGEAGGPGKASIGVAPVPDARVDKLTEIYKPQRTVYAQLECTELPPLQLQQQGTGAAPGGVSAQQLAEALRHIDAVVLVVRAFSSAHVPHVLGDVSALRDAKMLYEELLLMDWSLVETRLERLREARKKGLRHDEEIALFERLQPELEAGRPLRALEFTKDEAALLRGYSFLTTKPMVLAVNVDEEQLRQRAFDGAEELAAWARERAVPMVEVAALIEAEIEELPPEEQAAFLEDLGLEQPGVAPGPFGLQALDLISFSPRPSGRCGRGRCAAARAPGRRPGSFTRTLNGASSARKSSTLTTWCAKAAWRPSARRASCAWKEKTTRSRTETSSISASTFDETGRAGGAGRV